MVPTLITITLLNIFVLEIRIPFFMINLVIRLNNTKSKANLEVRDFDNLLPTIKVKYVIKI